MDNEQSASPVCDANSSNNVFVFEDLSTEELSKKFNYQYQTFWDKIHKAKVVIQDQSTIVTASKDLVAGLFLKKKCNEILSLALDLAFYVKRTSTADTFIYDAVSTFVSSMTNDENTQAEVAVNLEPKGWYERWVSKTSTTATTNALEKCFLDEFGEPEKNESTAFLGPWLATVLLRLEKRHPSYVANKIIKLYKHSLIMCGLEVRVGSFYVDEKYFQAVEALLKRFTKVSLAKQKRNALYRAMLEICRNKEKYDHDRVIRRILDFTTLQSMFYSGMTLVTLIDKFREKTRYLKTPEVIDILGIRNTMKSWDTYFHFCIFLKSLSKEEQYYTICAREFDSNVFENLTYAKNMTLCNYIAVLNDTGGLGRCFTVTDFGPTYKQLISNRSNVELLTNDDFRFCANAAADIEVKGFPLNSCAARVWVRVYEECLQKHQKIADEALKNAQFEQILADKYRKYVEEVKTRFKLESADTEKSLSNGTDEVIRIVKNNADIADMLDVAFESLEFESCSCSE